ncbi:MAG: ATP-binding protein [Candidatus Omnitrophica bacterium]|nr:ATP-binding protein [Candidatus Omnitrophota bacterium]
MKINNLSLAFLFSGFINLTLGLFVYIKGKRKLSNRLFAVFSFQLFIWCTISFIIASILDVRKAEFLVRFVYAYASFIPPTFCLFAFSLGEDHFLIKNLKFIILFYFLALINSYLSFSPNFIKEIYLVSPLEKGNIKTGPMVMYGTELLFYAIIIVFMLSSGLIYLYKKKKTKTGIVSLEIQYVFLAVLLGTIYNVTIAFLPMIFQMHIVDRLGPFATVIVSGVMVYGITRYKIMDISLVYEKFILYSALSFLLFLIFFSVNFFLKEFGEFFLINWGNFPLFLSGFCVALLFTPLKEKLQKFLRIKVLKLDIEHFSQKVFDEAFIFTDLPSLFKNLGDIIEEFLNVPPQILLLLKKDKKLRICELKDKFSNLEIMVEDNSLILEKLGKSKLLIREEEKRFEHTSPDKKEIVEEFEKYGYEIAISITRREEILGAIFLKRKKDGRVFNYRDQMLLLNLGSQLGIALENAELYNQISEVNSYIRNLLDNSPFGVISLDKDGRVSLVSKQMKVFLGKDEKELVGKNFRDVLPSDVIPLIERKYKNFDKEIIIDEIVYQNQNKNFIFSVNIVPIYDEKGKEIGIMVIFSDITKIKQLQDEIREKEKMASLGVMAAGVAHEIKNPLVAIKTFVDLFPERYKDPEFRDVYSRLLQDEVQRINHLVEQILLFANPKPMKVEKINILEMLKSIIMLWKFQNRDKDIKVIENFYMGNVIIKGDKERLKEVFFNLLANSYEAINNKEGIIEVYATEKKDNMVEICIADNGSGIKKEIMDRIFDPYFTTKDQGTGLGLSIVRKIVEEHGGNIKIESEENKGTKVYIRFPIIKKGINEVCDDFKRR